MPAWLAVVLVAAALLVGGVAGRLVGWRQSFSCGFERGRRSAQSEHNLPLDPIPGGHRRRWSRLNRKADDPPGLVTRPAADVTPRITGYR